MPIPREVRAEQRERMTSAKIVRLRVRALNEKRSTDERAAANAEANRLANLLRDRKS